MWEVEEEEEAKEEEEEEAVDCTPGRSSQSKHLLLWATCDSGDGKILINIKGKVSNVSRSLLT